MGYRLEHLRNIARQGGIARVKKHGNPGTASGRALGGLRSIRKHQQVPSAFKTLRSIRTPRPSQQLAEIVGILMGDGHVGLYQVSVVTNSQTDYAHAQFVKGTLERLFGVHVTMTKRKNKNALSVVVSSKKLADFFHAQGIPHGDKIKNTLTVPGWISRKKPYRKAFVRGLFDTDGCVYIDKHVYKGVTYKNIGMAFSNRSEVLLKYFKKSLEGLGMHPTQKTPFIVFLRRKKDILAYFASIGSSNPKHLAKVAPYTHAE